MSKTLYTLIAVSLSLMTVVVSMIIFNIVSMYLSAKYGSKNFILRIDINSEPYYLGWDNNNHQLNVDKCSGVVPLWFQKVEDDKGFYLKIPENCIYLSLEQSEHSGYVYNFMNLEYNNADNLNKKSLIKFETDNDNNQIMKMNNKYLSFIKNDETIKLQQHDSKPSSSNNVKLVSKVDVSCANKSFYCPSN